MTEPTGLPIPPKKKKTAKKKRGRPTKAEAAAKKAAQEVQDEVVTAEEVQHELTNRVMACLWRGEDLPRYSNDAYDLGYVEMLWKGIIRYVPRPALTMIVDEYYGNLMADDPRFHHSGIRLEKFQGHGIGGWSNILEVCRPDLRPRGKHRHMLVGLDTVFMGDCEWLFHWNKSPVGLPRDPFFPNKPCDAVWTFDSKGAEIVWDGFQAAKVDGMKDYLLFGKPSEMQLLRYLFQEYGWDYLEHLPYRLLSYKAHVLKGADPFRQKASIVYFHGTPKPHELPDRNRVKQAWVH